MCFDVFRGDYYVVFIVGLVYRDGFGGREWIVVFFIFLEDVWIGCFGRVLVCFIIIVGLIRLIFLFFVICY